MNITNEIYGSNPKKKDPKRKHAVPPKVPKKDKLDEKYISLEEYQEHKDLVDTNERLHALQARQK